MEHMNKEDLIEAYREAYDAIPQQALELDLIEPARRLGLVQG